MQNDLFAKFKKPSEEQQQIQIEDEPNPGQNEEYQNMVYQQNYKENWITHNMEDLEKSYNGWMAQNIEYNVTNQVPDSITTEDQFKANFPLQNFIEDQYNNFLAANFPGQQQLDDQLLTVEQISAQPHENEEVEQIQPKDGSPEASSPTS